MKPMLTFVFPNEELKQRFAAWMCDGGGEQEFMMFRSETLNFDYWQGRKFIENNVVEITIVDEEE